MNPFDAFVTAVALLAIVMGFRSGLLRSLATILGYLIAAPIAIAIAPVITPFVLGHVTLTPDQSWVPLFVVFVAVGIVVSVLLRTLVSEIVGPDAGLFDRLAGG